MRVLNALKRWVMSDAEWYEFWMPGSDWRGGLIAAGLMLAITRVVLWLRGYP